MRQALTPLFLWLETHQHDDVHPGLHQQVQPVLVVLSGADGGAAQQLFARVLGGQRVVAVLLQICPGDDGHQLVVVVHNGKFACRREEKVAVIIFAF